MNSVDQPLQIKAPIRVLVTGSRGFVGRWLLSALVRHREMCGEIVATSHDGSNDWTIRGDGSSLDNTDKFASPRFGDRLDICDAHAVHSFIEGFRPDAIIHLAAKSNVQEAWRTPQTVWDVNVRGTAIVAEAVRSIVPRALFLYVGSSESYGSSFNAWMQPVDETAPLAPLNPYAASKAAADLLIGRMSQDGLNSIRFRPFNHTGPGQNDRFVVPAFAAQIARAECGLQERVVRVGNLDAVRDFLDVRDVVAAYVRGVFLKQPLQPGSVLNIASGVPRRIGDILEALLPHARIPIQIEIDPGRIRPSDLPVAVGDASRARALLGWQPTIPWEQTLIDVLSDQRERFKSR